MSHSSAKALVSISVRMAIALSALLLEGMGNLGTIAATPDCTSPGEVCSDGSILTGVSTTVGKPLFIMAVDGPGDVDHPGMFQYSWGPHDAAHTLALCENEEAVGDICGNGQIASLEVLKASAEFKRNNSGWDRYHAATFCDTLDYHGRTDWFLPARDELLAIFKAIGLREDIGMRGNFYWSSSPQTPWHFWAVYFEENNGSNLVSQSGALRVRCVRVD